MPSRLLPSQFKQLDPFVESWALASETARLQRRFVSTIEDLKAFYEAILPQMDAIIAYLNQFSLEKMPDEARRLFYLCLSLAEVAPAVELFKQPRVPDGFDVNRIIPIEDKSDFGAAQA